MGERKRIGILTSGGDCAGLNAVIRAVVYRAIGTYGWEVRNSSSNPWVDDSTPSSHALEIEKVDSLLTAGGTVLGTTNKGDPFPMPNGTLSDRSEIVAGYHQLGLA